MCTLRLFFCFFFNDTATTEIYTLSLHDALPRSRRPGAGCIRSARRSRRVGRSGQRADRRHGAACDDGAGGTTRRRAACVAARGAAGPRGVQARDGMMGFDLIFGPSVERGPRDRKIYLTFDDGPNERATPAILETLTAARVPAAFFMVGDHVRRFP